MQRIPLVGALAVLLIAGAVVIGQQALTYRAFSTAVNASIEVGDPDQNDIGKATLDKTPTLAAYIESGAFDEYREDFVAHDPGSVELRVEAARGCADAHRSIVLPPFRDRAEDTCTRLAAVVEKSNAWTAQVVAMAPYVQECRRLRFTRGYYGDDAEGSLADYPPADFDNAFEGQTVDGADLRRAVLTAVAADCSLDPVPDEDAVVASPDDATVPAPTAPTG